MNCGTTRDEVDRLGIDPGIRDAIKNDTVVLLLVFFIIMLPPSTNHAISSGWSPAREIQRFCGSRKTTVPLGKVAQTQW